MTIRVTVQNVKRKWRHCDTRRHEARQSVTVDSLEKGQNQPLPPPTGVRSAKYPSAVRVNSEQNKSSLLFIYGIFVTHSIPEGNSVTLIDKIA